MILEGGCRGLFYCTVTSFAWREWKNYENVSVIVWNSKPVPSYYKSRREPSVSTCCCLSVIRSQNGWKRECVLRFAADFKGKYWLSNFDYSVRYNRFGCLYRCVACSTARNAANSPPDNCASLGVLLFFWFDRVPEVEILHPSWRLQTPNPTSTTTYHPLWATLNPWRQRRFVMAAGTNFNVTIAYITLEIEYCVVNM